MMIVPGSAFITKAASGDGCDDPLTDFYWGNVELLCWCNGVDDGTTFTDETGNYTITNNSDLVTTQTGNKKFGTAGAVFPYDADQRLEAGDTNDWNFLHDGTTKFTAEMWFKNGTDRVAMFATCSGATNKVGVFFHLLDGGEKFGLYVFKGTAPATIAIDTPVIAALADGEFHHVAFQFDSDETDSYQIFVDGNLEVDGAATSTYSSADSEFPLYIGGTPSSFYNLEVDGAASSFYYIIYKDFAMDDIRITKGIARYPASGFTPPCRQFPNTD